MEMHIPLDLLWVVSAGGSTEGSRRLSVVHLC